MRRILEPGQIEAFAEGAIPRLRLPERTTVFAARARRLRQQGAPGAPGQAIGAYLHLMAAVADAQQAALGTCEPPLPTATQLARSHTHGMPLIHAGSWPRERTWRALVAQMCAAVAAAGDVPPGAREACERLRDLQPVPGHREHRLPLDRGRRGGHPRRVLRWVSHLPQDSLSGEGPERRAGGG